MKHGGDLADAWAADPADPRPWLDLSTGINPHPWPIPDEVRFGDWTRLPSRQDGDALSRAARRAYGVPDGAGIVAAPGTQALIQWLPRLLPAGAVSILGPTYSEHEASWRLVGARVSCVRSAGAVPPDAVHVVVVNPNNPDGRILGEAALVALAERCGRAGGVLVVDESFADVVPEASIVGRTGDLPIVVLRSFGKFFGLAGLRLGFAIAPDPIATRIANALGPWPIAAPALAAGTLALADEAWATRTRQSLAEESRELDTVLAGAGLTVVGGTHLFRLAAVPDAGRLHATLAREKIWVRRFDWSSTLLRFGLSPDAAGRERLATALAGSG